MFHNSSDFQLMLYSFPMSEGITVVVKSMNQCRIIATLYMLYKYLKSWLQYFIKAAKYDKSLTVEICGIKTQKLFSYSPGKMCSNS